MRHAGTLDEVDGPARRTVGEREDQLAQRAQIVCVVGLGGFHDQVVRTCVASGDRDTAVMPVAMIADAPGPVGVEMQGGASRGTLRGIVENDPLLVER